MLLVRILEHAALIASGYLEQNIIATGRRGKQLHEVIVSTIYNDDNKCEIWIRLKVLNKNKDESVHLGCLLKSSFLVTQKAATQKKG